MANRLSFNIVALVTLLVTVGVLAKSYWIFPTRQTPTVTVIGAGLSGLMAMKELEDAGISVEMYEARQRVGGRVYTVMINGVEAELGAENILDGGIAEHIRGLIDSLGLEYTKNFCGQTSNIKIQHITHDGIIDTAKRLQAYQLDAESLKKTLTEIADSSESMHDVLEEFFDNNQFLKEHFSSRLAGYEGPSPEKLSPMCVESLYNMLLGEANDVFNILPLARSPLDHLSVKGGNAQIPLRLAEKIRGPIHFGYQLSKIEKTKSGNYKLTFANGHEVISDIVLLTIPCPVYNDIEFGPNTLPQEQLKNIRSICYGMNSKIQVPCQAEAQASVYINEKLLIFRRFNDPFTTLFFINGNSYFTPANVHQHMLSDFALVTKAYGQEVPAETATYGNDINYAEYTGPVGYSWLNDPLAKGSYSYIGAGQEKIFTELKDYDGEIIKVVFTPADNLYFAGEHACTNCDICGTMEAAVQSGKQAARLIKKKLTEEIE